MNETSKQIPIIPMRGCPVFPGHFTSIEVTDIIDIKVVDSLTTEDFGVLLLKNESKQPIDLAQEDFYSIGTVVRIKNKVNTLFSTRSLHLETICRFKVLNIVNIGGEIHAVVDYIKEDTLTEVENRAYLDLLNDLMPSPGDSVDGNLASNLANIFDAIKYCDYVASTLVPRPLQQSYLDILPARDRIKKLLVFLNDEKKAKKLKDSIQGEVSTKFDKKQKEIFLREELRIIQDKLSNLDSDNDEIDDVEELSDEDIVEGAKQTQSPKRKTLYEKLVDLNLQGEVKETVFNEYSKMNNMDSNNPEYSMLRTYLETVTQLPWNDFSDDNFSLEEAREILEKDHYGIKEVKDRIIEFLSVRKLKNDTKGSIICLVGPPGTGKTSVGSSIAKALHKKYYRFSVGGMRDEAEIKGHRRTYIGSMPGQIIKGLKVTKVKNPVFVIDEIDKMTISNQGDPAAALLEVLDPEQNSSFRDHYMEIPFDVSNVLFILTANTLDTIPRPLLDRMECIELNGYTSEEKLHIGKKYLVPKSREKNGLKAKDIKYSDTILRKIAEEYAREAGVRNFEKALDKIHRKVATELVSNPETQRPVVIDEEKLIKYLGQTIFTQDEIIRASKPGMAVGLAWTSMGGDVLAIEAQKVPGKEELKLTGQLGDVMKESATIAFSYVKAHCEEHGVKPDWFNNTTLHLHVPEGATPKDGPSAGITMATAMFSLITGKTIIKDLAMTGELSLIGKVMPIGGLKEKVLAAKRNKIKTIIIPKFNKRDLDKLEDNVKKGIDFKLVSDMEEVFDIAFCTGRKK